MPASVGYRAKIGMLIPSTNTVVEHDTSLVGAPGVTFHSARLYIERPAFDSTHAVVDVLDQVRASLDIAIRDVMTCGPDHLVMCMTAESFWGGAQGNAGLEGRIRERSGVGATTGATAVCEALQRFGARRIAVLNPYQPVVEEHIARYFDETGFEVVRTQSLLSPTTTAVADIDDAALVDALRRIDGPDVDAVIQAGANLSMIRLADAAERWLGKPVIAINAAMIWHALRHCGVQDQFETLGRLLREH
jgi:maleate isomerase